MVLVDFELYDDVFVVVEDEIGRELDSSFCRFAFALAITFLSTNRGSHQQLTRSVKHNVRTTRLRCYCLAQKSEVVVTYRRR